MMIVQEMQSCFEEEKKKEERRRWGLSNDQSILQMITFVDVYVK
jgi:hypothetical protein